MMEEDDVRGQKRGPGEDEEAAKRPRVHGFDDDVEDGAMIASSMELKNEEIIEGIFAVLDEEMPDLVEEWCLGQPDSLDPQLVLRNRGIEGDRLLKYKVYEEVDEKEYDPELDDPIIDGR